MILPAEEHFGQLWRIFMRWRIERWVCPMGWTVTSWRRKSKGFTRDELLSLSNYRLLPSWSWLRVTGFEWHQFSDTNGYWYLLAKPISAPPVLTYRQSSNRHFTLVTPLSSEAGEHKEMNNLAFHSAHVSQCETPHVNMSVITQATITTSSVFRY